MANYRFKAAEIEAMKKNILTHIEHEAETKTAWRLRCAIEGQLMCCRPSKREAARLERELALYEKLTKNDLPNWQSEPTQPAQPTETPRIVRVEIVRDFDKSYYANLYGENGGCHNLSKEYTDFRTLKTLCKKEYGVNLPNLSQIEFETHGRKSYAYISTETPRISTETVETTNVSAEGENTAETKENCHSDTRIVSDGYGNQYEVTRLWENGRVESLDVIILDTQPQTATEPPQPPETPQIVECIADTSKPRETARKRPNRGIGRASATRRDALRNTLRPVTYVPRECSTADYW